MSFDIALGKCVGINTSDALVSIDYSVLQKLKPGSVATFPIQARLQVPLGLCSATRKPANGHELFVDFDKIKDGGGAYLDCSGSGEFVPTDIRLLAENLEPGPRPAPIQKQRAHNWPLKQ